MCLASKKIWLTTSSIWTNESLCERRAESQPANRPNFAHEFRNKSKAISKRNRGEPKAVSTKCQTVLVPGFFFGFRCAREQCAPRLRRFQCAVGGVSVACKTIFVLLSAVFRLSTPNKLQVEAKLRSTGREELHEYRREENEGEERKRIVRLRA